MIVDCIFVAMIVLIAVTLTGGVAVQAMDCWFTSYDREDPW